MTVTFPQPVQSSPRTRSQAAFFSHLPPTARSRASHHITSASLPAEEVSAAGTSHQHQRMLPGSIFGDDVRLTCAFPLLVLDAVLDSTESEPYKRESHPLGDT